MFWEGPGNQVDLQERPTYVRLCLFTTSQTTLDTWVVCPCPLASLVYTNAGTQYKPPLQTPSSLQLSCAFGTNPLHLTSLSSFVCVFVCILQCSIYHGEFGSLFFAEESQLRQSRATETLSAKFQHWSSPPLLLPVPPSLTCVHDHPYACVCTRGLGTHPDNFFDSEKLNFFGCS